jgi:hypothetical protein
MRRVLPQVVVLACFVLVSAACRQTADKTPTLPTAPTSSTAPAVDSDRYYAVLLNNGTVYFGKLEGLGSRFPVLRDVFYIQSSVNQQTKAVSNNLIKRGKELHAPDMMMINASAIVFIEPVGPQSRVAQLIDEAKKTEVNGQAR